MKDMIRSINESICFALGIDAKNTSSVKIEYTPDKFPVVTTKRTVAEDTTAHCERIKNSAEYKEVLEDPREIVLIEEMATFFHEKLIETKSFDAAFTKAIWRAYLQGIKVGSKQEIIAPQLESLG